MKFPCTKHKCTWCCQETEMPLLESDIQRMMDLGHSYDDFVMESDGYLQLRNWEGRCFFHDGTKCTIYEARPEGCQSYPLLFDEDTGVLLDHDCLHWTEVKFERKDQEGVINLVGRLKQEKKNRL